MTAPINSTIPAPAPNPTFCFVLIDYTNRSDVVAFLPQLRDALDESLNQHFAPFHGGHYAFRVASSPTDKTSGEVAMNIRHAAPGDPSGAEGWHQDNNGVPDIELPLDTMSGLTGDSNCLDVVADHEAKETAGDPGANQLVDNGNGKVSARETCDRVEDITYAASNGLNLSDFLLPAAWIPGAIGPYSYRGSLQAQLDSNNAVTKTPGGYDIEATAPSDYTDAKGNITQKKATMAQGAAMHPGSIARKSHWSSRAYRRGVRLAP